MYGTVQSIFIAKDSGLPMQEVKEIKAIAQLGLEGDRYAGEKGAWSKSKRRVIRQVSLIEQDAIDETPAKLETDFLTQDTRRNIVVKNFPLNGLIGKEFLVGPVRMRGVELCDPCQRPSQLSGKPGFENKFHGRGGLRAEILTSGIIRIGDEIKICE